MHSAMLSFVRLRRRPPKTLPDIDLSIVQACWGCAWQIAGPRERGVRLGELTRITVFYPMKSFALTDSTRKRSTRSSKPERTTSRGTIDSIRRLIAPEFEPTRVLDFGCGVGRLVLPFARRAAEVVGADISPEMLDEAQRNATNAGLTNATFVRVDEHLENVPGQFDLVHAYIVLQHIPPARGERIMLRLARKLVPGGVGALHFVYRRDASAARKIVHGLRKHVPGVNEVVNVVQRRAIRDPFIPMYTYSLDRVIDSFRSIGCSEVNVSFTDHGGHIGAMMFFRMP